MTKTIEQYFADWEATAFGFGYGSGELHVLPALKALMDRVPSAGSYQYDDLEHRIGATVTWLLLNVLHRQDIFEYGTSTRYAWLTKSGKALKQFLAERSADELVRIVCSRTQHDIVCYPDACNCGPEGYQKGVICANPFWVDLRDGRSPR